jgi:hypothetical protein
MIGSMLAALGAHVIVWLWHYTDSAIWYIGAFTLAIYLVIADVNLLVVERILGLRGQAAHLVAQGVALILIVYAVYRHIIFWDTLSSDAVASQNSKSTFDIFLPPSANFQLLNIEINPSFEIVSLVANAFKAIYSLMFCIVFAFVRTIFLVCRVPFLTALTLCVMRFAW